MKFFTDKKIVNRIIIVIIIVTIINFISPTISGAAKKDKEGDLFQPICEFLCYLADLVMDVLQKIFIGESFGVKSLKDFWVENYDIKYSPGIIFSGNVPALDINFFTPADLPKKTVVQEENNTNTVEKNEAIVYDHNQFMIYPNKDNEDYILINLNNVEMSSVMLGQGGANPSITIKYYTDEPNNDNKYYEKEMIKSGYNYLSDIYSKASEDIYNYYVYKFQKESGKGCGTEEAGEYASQKIIGIVNSEKESDKVFKQLYVLILKELLLNYNNNQYLSEEFLKIREPISLSQESKKSLQELDDAIKTTNTFDNDTVVNIENKINNIEATFSSEFMGGDLKNFEREEEIKSSAAVLQPIVATWYKALRAIALVGLLSVLVYIGIRILISSTGQEKAKYKKMIGDWLVAICILFVLQYIMIFTLEICSEITNTLSVKVVGEEGQDILMSKVRSEIADEDEDFTDIFPATVIYLVLVVFTCIFTVQYLKRVLYMAFFTMIAPLIALTYPLDKIKDGQAQAFSIWLKEYIFYALLQPMHLLIYYIFVTSASKLADSNWIYAIVAIGFLVPAEAFFRKMFGFDKAESTGQLGAAAGGALAMNAINSLNSSSKKQTTEESSGGGNPQTSPRYIRAPGTESGDGETNLPGRRTGGGANPPGSTGRSTAFGKTIEPASKKGKMNLANGAKTLAGHYINRGNAKKLGKGLLKGAIKGTVGLAGAATLGTLGLAIGTATGDAGKALGYGAAGLGAGFSAGSNLTDKAMKFEKKNREIFKEGALGTEEYETGNIIKELTDDNYFNSTCKTLGIKDQKGREKLIRQFRNNGIKNSKDIRKAVIARVKAKASQEEVIAAYKIKKQAKRDGLKTADLRKRLMKEQIKGEELNHVMSIIDML